MADLNEVGAFTIHPDIYEQVKEACKAPHGLAMQGWEFLERHHVASQPRLADRETQDGLGWAMELGLGFGVGLSNLVVEHNQPDFEPYNVHFPVPTGVGRDAGRYIGHALAAEIEHVINLNHGIDSSLVGITVNVALPNVRLGHEYEMRLFLATVRLGHQVVSAAYDQWEFEATLAMQEHGALEEEFAKLTRDEIDLEYREPRD